MSGLCIIILLGIRIIPTSLCLSDQTRCLLAGIEQNAFETGVLLVSSRYYDPEVGRWITPEPNAYEGELLWSSFFVTLVAKKYRLATMLPFVPRMVCDSR